MNRTAQFWSAVLWTTPAVHVHSDVQSVAERQVHDKSKGSGSRISGLRAEGTRLVTQVKESRSNVSLRRRVFALTMLIPMLSMRVYSEQKNSDTTASVQSFLGRWDLTLRTPLREYPSWLEIAQDGTQLKARMVSRWGHARQLSKCEVSNGRITFVSPKEEEDRKDDMVFEGKLSGKTLVGSTTGPDGTPWQWTGEKAPSLKRKAVPQWGNPTQLFNGKDLSGWKMSHPGPTATWKIENGTLVSPGHGPELIVARRIQLRTRIEQRHLPTWSVRTPDRR